MPDERDPFQEVRDSTGALLCRVDPGRAVLEVKHRRGLAYVDLTRYGLVPAQNLDKRAAVRYNAPEGEME